MTEDSKEDVFVGLKEYLSKVPSVSGAIGAGYYENQNWWVKFTINYTFSTPRGVCE